MGKKYMIQLKIYPLFLLIFMLISACAGSTPLIRATKRCNFEKLRSLLENGSDIDATDRLGWTALLQASFCLNHELVQALIDAGADVNYKAPYTGSTALHYAIQQYSNTDVVKIILKAGADVNAKDNRGRTPLHKAVLIGRADIVQMLLEAGADVYAKDNEGNSALSFSSDHKYLTVLLKYNQKAKKSETDEFYSSPFIDNEVESRIMQFTTEFYSLIGDINTKNRPVSHMIPYFAQIDDSLIGISIRDGLSKHISIYKNNQLLDVIENYLNDNEDVSDFIRKELEYVDQKRKNYRKYVKSIFCFSTVLYRLDILPDLTIILPNADWSHISTTINKHSIIAGDDANSGIVIIKTEIISSGYDITKDVNINDFGIVYFSRSNMKGAKNAYVEKYREIASNNIIGSQHFLKIFERQQYSDGNSKGQEVVSTERIYIKETEKTTIIITNFIAASHLLTDIEKLKTVQCKILDSVLFN